MNLTQYHPCVEEIISLLKKNQIEFEFFEHESVKTSLESARARKGFSLKQGVKALILQVGDKSGKHFIQVVLPGDKRFQNSKLRRVLNLSNIRFATEEELFELTNGIQPGGVPPFGNLFGLKIYADKSIFDEEKIIFNCGDRRTSISIKSEDYKKLVDPQVFDIAG